MSCALLLTEYTPDQELVYTRNDEYAWGPHDTKAPKFETLRVEIQPEALRAALQQARSLGVARDAVVQVIQMGAHLAVHGTALGITVLAELDAA